MVMITDWLDQVQKPTDIDADDLKDRVVTRLKNIYDPELPVNIYDLGLIYKLDVDQGGVVSIDMTLTAPGCPVAQTFPGTVEQSVRELDGVTTVHVELVWEPPWCPDVLSDEVKLQLGIL